ncbi:hypothetical protein D3Z55_06795 [Clostridiaceae bacterium]|nr:hypothetical protein [Clostridiaceae bacterium]
MPVQVRLPASCGAKQSICGFSFAFFAYKNDKAGKNFSKRDNRLSSFIKKRKTEKKEAGMNEQAECKI